MSLKNQVMVVTLNISQWTARKKDVEVNREVEANHNAFDAGNYSKHLISKDAVVGNQKVKKGETDIWINPLKAIGKLAGSVRTWHYFNTLPWSDSGDRILPSKNYFNYVTELGKFKSEWDELVDEFLNQYPKLVDEARHRLGSIFKESDYPTTEQLRSKFDLRYSFYPVADKDDIRINLSDDEVKSIKAQVAEEINSRVQVAVDDMLRRIKEAVSHMAETLIQGLRTKPAVKKIKSSVIPLVGNICSLIETIPLLNFNDDPHVAEVVELIRPLCIDPELLRTDPEHVRKSLTVLRMYFL